MAYVYIVKCSDDTYYTGIAKDIKKRMKEHYLKTKNSAKYTRARSIVEIESVWKAESMSSAAKLEWQIKSLTRGEKQDLIDHPEKLGLFYCSKVSEYKFELIKDITLAQCITDEKEFNKKEKGE